MEKMRCCLSEAEEKDDDAARTGTNVHTDLEVGRNVEIIEPPTEKLVETLKTLHIAAMTFSPTKQMRQSESWVDQVLAF